MKGLLGIFALVLVSCGTPETLSVRQFHLRKTKVSGGNEFVSAESAHRLYGAITAKERKARLGQYYTVVWNDLNGEESVRVVMEYRQALKGSRVLRMSQSFPAAKSGKTEFKVTDRAYEKWGRVVSWQISLYQGKEKVAVKRSYLWE